VLVGGPGRVGVVVRVGVDVRGTELVGVGVLVLGAVVLVGGTGVLVSGGFGVRVGVDVRVAVARGVGDGVEVAGSGPVGGYKFGCGMISLAMLGLSQRSSATAPPEFS
jgi:hypothetical protein